MGKGKKKKYSPIGLDIVAYLESRISNLEKENIQAKTKHAEEIKILHEKWRQSKNDIVKNMVKTDTSDYQIKIHLLETENTKLKQLVSEIENDLAKQKAVSKTIKETSKQTSERLHKEIDYYKQKEEENYQQQSKWRDEFKQETETEQEIFMVSYKQELQKNMEAKFQEEFEKRNKEELNKFRKVISSRTDKIKKRRQSLDEAEKKLIKESKKNEKKLQEIKIQQKKAERAYHENEAIIMNSKKIKKDLEYIQEKYQEIDTEVIKKKKQIKKLDTAEDNFLQKAMKEKGMITYSYFVNGDNGPITIGEEHYEYLEKVKLDESSEYKFSNGRNTWKVVKFKDDTIHQINISTGNVRKIFKKIINLTSELVSIPLSWNVSSKEKVMQYEIYPEDKNYQAIRDYFNQGWFEEGEFGECKIKNFKIFKNENLNLWLKYYSSQYVKSTDIKPRHDYDTVLNETEDELICFHGSTYEGVSSICQQGIKIYRAKRCMYGQGFYGAFQSKKSHQYSKNSRKCYMIVGGIKMGKTYCTKEEHWDIKSPNFNGIQYDSIFAQGRVARGGAQYHDELIVFDSDQFYPKYWIEYDVE